MRFQTKSYIAGTMLSIILAGCGGGGSNNSVPPPAPPPPPPANAVFEVTMTNLTLAQPLSPPAIVFHTSEYRAFTDGVISSEALEILAEGGDRQPLIDEATASTGFLAAFADENPVPPLGVSPTETITILESDLEGLLVTAITMLVHTNDAFTGVNSVDLSNMAVGETQTINGPTWDAGTEDNTENAATMPGPDFGGEGFNATRDDRIDRVRFHQGVVTSASVESGFPESALEERHRFDNPTSRLRITRVE